MPQWKCSSYDAMQNWNDEEILNARIPDAAFDIIDKLVEKIDKLDYRNPNSEIPERMQMLAVAVFEFCTAANVYPSSGGGGGGSDNDLRWDGKTEEDFENMARNAVGKAKKDAFLIYLKEVLREDGEDNRDRRINVVVLLN